MTDRTQDRIRAIIAEQAMLEPDQISDDSTPEDLGIDSLGLVEAIFAIEEEFDISIPFNANEPDKSDFDSTRPSPARRAAAFTRTSRFRSRALGGVLRSSRSARVAGAMSSRARSALMRWERRSA